MELSREIVAILLVLGLLGACLYALRRFRPSGAAVAGPLRATGKLRLSENLVLHLVHCDGQPCLVAEQKTSCALVILPTGGRAC